MVPTYWIAICVAVIFVMMCILSIVVVYAVWAVRNASVEATTSTVMHEAHSVPISVEPDVLRLLGQRIVLLESRLPAFQAAIDSYGNITQRVADVEGRLPNLIEAFDKFNQQVLNSDKRAATRESRANKKTEPKDGEIPVEQAFAAMGMAATAGDEIEAPAPARAVRAGALGQGGNGARPR